MNNETPNAEQSPGSLERMVRPRVGDIWSFGWHGREVTITKIRRGICGQWSRENGKLVPFGRGPHKCVWVNTTGSSPCCVSHFMRDWVFVRNGSNGELTDAGPVTPASRETQSRHSVQ